MKLIWEFHFQNNTGMSQIICIYMLLITTFFSTQLPSYWSLFVVILWMPIYILKYNIFNYCNIWLNQYRSHWYFFRVHLHCLYDTLSFSSVFSSDESPSCRNLTSSSASPAAMLPFFLPFFFNFFFIPEDMLLSFARWRTLFLLSNTAKI